MLCGRQGGLEVAVEVPSIEGMKGEVATVVKWMKREGDEVREDESLVLLEFPKTEVEVPSPASGTLKRIVVREGRMARVHDRVAIIETKA
jgi:pyruvate/2-oxoglutarate dehydrogenase complex dihydrolipoamide acyltransferase (E2) component